MGGDTIASGSAAHAEFQYPLMDRLYFGGLREIQRGNGGRLFQYPLMDRLYFGGNLVEQAPQVPHGQFQYPLMDRLYFGGLIQARSMTRDSAGFSIL